jgi:hypothetical protein
MDETEVVEQPAYSGKLENIFKDGTVQYNGARGYPEEFPLTEAELREVSNP